MRRCWCLWESVCGLLALVCLAPSTSTTLGGLASRCTVLSGWELPSPLLDPLFRYLRPSLPPYLSTATLAHFARRCAPGCTAGGCDTTEEVWACLHCSHFACGRGQKEHALAHYKDTGHPCVVLLGATKYVHCCKPSPPPSPASNPACSAAICAVVFPVGATWQSQELATACLPVCQTPCTWLV